MDTAAQTIANVRLRLEDPDGVFFSTSDLVRAYNDALDEISEQTEVRESSVYVKRRKWCAYVDLRGILPPNALRVTAVWNPNSGKWLDPTSVTEMDQTVGRKWEANIGTSRWWWMRGLWHLGTYPVAGDDISPVRIHYTSLLPNIEEDGGLVTGLTSTPIDLPPDYTTVIEHYMMYDLLAERKEVKKALEHFAMFQDAMPALKDLAENRMRRDRTPKLGAHR